MQYHIIHQQVSEAYAEIKRYLDNKDPHIAQLAREGHEEAIKFDTFLKKIQENMIRARGNQVLQGTIEFECWALKFYADRTVQCAQKLTSVTVATEPIFCLDEDWAKN